MEEVVIWYGPAPSAETIAACGCGYNFDSFDVGEEVGCNNCTFGDPCYGTVKHCYTSNPDYDPNARKLADENQSFTANLSF